MPPADTADVSVQRGELQKTLSGNITFPQWLLSATECVPPILKFRNVRGNKDYICCLRRAPFHRYVVGYKITRG